MQVLFFVRIETNFPSNKLSSQIGLICFVSVSASQRLTRWNVSSSTSAATIMILPWLSLFILLALLFCYPNIQSWHHKSLLFHVEKTIHP